MLADLFHEESDDQLLDGSDQALSGEIKNNSKLVKPPEERSKVGFVGLENQGATCYLNSLIQAMYMTTELRYGLYQIDPLELGGGKIEEENESKTPARDKKEQEHISSNSPINKNKDSMPPGKNKIKNKVKSKTAASTSLTDDIAFEVNESLVQQLVGMGFSEGGAHRSVMATKNASFDAALEYAFSHSDDKGFNDKIEADAPGSSRKKVKPRLIPLELQSLFTKMQSLNRKAISTENLTAKGFQWQSMDGAVQHDAHELNRLLFDALEKSLKHTSGENLIKSLYEGNLAYQTQCLNCSVVREKEEKYFDLLLQVTSMCDVADSLRNYTAPELLDGRNKYECDICGDKQPAHRRVAIKSVPPILSLSCQRFDIDRTTWQRVKVISKFEFPLVLDMSLCVSGHNNASEVLSSPVSEDPAVEQERTNILRDRMIFLDVVLQTAKREAERLICQYGSEFSVSDVLAIPEEYQYLRQQLKFWNASPNEESDSIYELFAVIMHGGTAYSGHYTAYIRDTFHEGAWFTPEEKSTGSGSGSKARKGKAREVLCAVLTPKGHYVIDETSPLCVVLTIVQMELNTGTEKYMPISKLSSCIKDNLGKTWSDMYQADHGTLTAFIRRHGMFFAVDGSAKGIKIGLKDIKYQVVSAEIYEKAGRESEVKEGGGHGAGETVETAETQMESQLADDLALALSLESENIEEELKASEDVEEEAGGSGWEDVGEKKNKKKSRRQLNKEGAKAAARKNNRIKTQHTATSISKDSEQKEKDATENEEVNSEVQAQDRLLASIINSLVNEFYGPFFSFNDSIVQPIELNTLIDAFDGRTSAYILIYRKAGNCSSSPLVAVKPPAVYSDAVQKMNSELALSRESYDRLASCYRLNVFFSKDLLVEWPLVRIASSSGKGMEVEVDIRGDVECLISAIVKRSQELSVTPYLHKDTLVVGKLETYGGSFFLRHPFSACDTIASTLTNHTQIYVITKSDLEKSQFQPLYAPPRRLAITMDKVGSKDELEKLELTIPSSTNLGELVDLVSRYAAASVSEFVLYLIRHKQLSARKSGKQYEYTYSVLWKNSEVAKPFSAAATYDGIDGTEVIVEMLNGQKPSSTNLADREVARRNRLWCVTVDLDYTGNLNHILRDYAIGGLHYPCAAVEEGKSDAAIPADAIVRTSSSIDTSVKIEIDKFATIAELKRQALLAMTFGEHVFSKSRIRNPANKGDNIISNEVASLDQCDLKDGSSVLLELLSLEIDSGLDLRYSVVTGNDKQAKHNPAVAGARHSERTVVCQNGEWIRDVKRRMVEQCWGDHWDALGVDVADVCNNTRLRLTNWAGECQELLIEVDDNEELVDVASAVKQNLIKRGDLLLLEEGRLPVKGMRDFKIFLWRPEEFVSNVDAPDAIDPELFPSLKDNGFDIHPDRLAKKNSTLTFVGDVQCHEESSLKDFQESCFALIQEHFNGSCPIASSDQILIRELREDMLPGLAHWIVTSKIATSTSSAQSIISSIGKAKPTNTAKVDTTSNSKAITIKKCGLKSGIEIVVELLAEPQTKTGAPVSGSISFWAQLATHKVINDNSTQRHELVLTPTWPPLEVELSAGLAPNFSHLKRLLAFKFSLSFDNLKVYKYFVHNSTWVELKPGMKSTTKKGRKSNVENIVNSPYCLRDGDLIVVREASSDVKLESEIPIIDRVEDAYERWINESSKKEDEGRSAEKISNRAAKKKNTAEITLKFGGDLDFSEGEDEDDESD